MAISQQKKKQTATLRLLFGSLHQVIHFNMWCFNYSLVVFIGQYACILPDEGYQRVVKMLRFLLTGKSPTNSNTTRLFFSRAAMCFRFTCTWWFSHATSKGITHHSYSCFMLDTSLIIELVNSICRDIADSKLTSLYNNVLLIALKDH